MIKATNKKIKRLVFRAVFIIALGLLLGYGMLRFLDWRYPPDLSRYHDISTVVTDRQGQLLRVYLSADQQWRLKTQFSDLPGHYLDLLINYEDRHFYDHHGIDFGAVLRAIGQNVVAGKRISGASTITMQVARLLRPKSRTWRHKIIEAFRAWQLERRLNKSDILAMYATLAPMGGNLEGITAASYRYFSKPPDKLSLSESAWLVVLPQSPNRYRVDKHPIAGQSARDKVLKRAVDNGIISGKAYHQAVAETMRLYPMDFPFLAPHIADRARRHHPDKTLIKTSLDSELQQQLSQLLARALPQRHEKSNLAAAIIDNHSGKPLAYTGSADFFSTERQGQIDMLRAVRSPGSALKPFITLYAFDWLGYQPQTTIDDTPITASDYRPGNYDGQFLGRMSLKQALLRSRNIPAVRLLKRIRPDYFVAQLRQSGLPLHLPKNARPNLSIALGGVGVRGWELAQLYRQLALCSYARQPQTNVKMPLAKQQACWQVTEILQQNGDGQGPLVFGAEPVAFKTGTAYGWRDRWLFAYTRDYTVVLWGGRADGGFAQQRSSAEALIPLLREIVGLLPNPPRYYAPPKLPYQIRTQNLPPRLRHVGTETNRRKSTAGELSNNPNALRFVTPLNGSDIEWQDKRSIALRISGGEPPYLWLLNDQLIGQSSSRQYDLLPASEGSYQVSVIDADGNARHSHFSLSKKQTQQVIKRTVLHQDKD
ncbi:MAG: penicillin-binding protein 1C [Gammaproteobacteria bacterium]|nr:MAG: penicillin-binding protein 1C [Gammaproteobacteria bacterium]